MPPQGDTLDIKPIRFNNHDDLPMAAVARAEAVNNPDAAAAARARIAQLNEPRIPAGPALITSKSQLAAQHAVKPKLPVSLPKKPQMPSRLQPILVAGGIFLLTLLAFKAPVLINQLQYQGPQANVVAPVAVPGQQVSQDPVISIPKINLQAPIVYEPSVREVDVQKALESGVVHYGNTPKPGEPGNSVFFGHSSNDWWQPGNFKFVFVMLNKLVAGDRFTINYQGTPYVYEVTGSKVVDPTDLSVLNPTPTPTATLITCTPPGTTWKRLVITAKQVSPEPSTAVAEAVATPNALALPGDNSGFFGQLWDSVTSVFSGSSR